MITLRSFGFAKQDYTFMDKRLPDDKGQLLEMYDAVLFSRDAIARFPALSEELRENENQLHLQIAVLARAVYEALHRNDTGIAIQVFSFLEQALIRPRAISEIANAVAISFVELCELRRTENGRISWDQMPERLKMTIQQGNV